MKQRVPHTFIDTLGGEYIVTVVFVLAYQCQNNINISANVVDFVIFDRLQK